MIEALQHLHEDEIGLLKKAPVYITVLMASADGKIQKNELTIANDTIDAFATEESDLQGYYKEVQRIFGLELKGYLILLSDDPEVRIRLMEERLVSLNAILEKIDVVCAQSLYESWKKLAYLIAKAAGGFLGMGTIDEREHAYLNLSMISIPNNEQ